MELAQLSTWNGRFRLVPWQHSSGGKQMLGRISKMGRRDIRRLLIIGATSVVRWRGREGGCSGSWLSGMLERKPRTLVAIALANMMARMARAMLTCHEDKRDSADKGCSPRQQDSRRCKEEDDLYGQMIEKIRVGQASEPHGAKSSYS